VTPYYESGGITIYHGNCLEVLPTLGRVQSVIMDPPYSEYVHSKSRRGGSDGLTLDGAGKPAGASFSKVKEFGFDAMTEELRGSVAAFCGTLTSRWTLTFSDVESSHLWRDALVSAALDYCRTGAWIKIGATPQFTGDRPAVGFEAITICHQHGRKRWNGGGSHAVWSVPIVLNRSGDDPRLHTTQKPEALLRELVRLFSDEGDTVLDPFLGSGTTLAACKRLNRRGIGIELDEQYCEIAAKRMEATLRQDSLFADTPEVA
jgi:site-specific DNA-methyltransferase (adenine-specific)